MQCAAKKDHSTKMYASYQYSMVFRVIIEQTAIIISKLQNPNGHISSYFFFSFSGPSNHDPLCELSIKIAMIQEYLCYLSFNKFNGFFNFPNKIPYEKSQFILIFYWHWLLLLPSPLAFIFKLYYIFVSFFSFDFLRKQGEYMDAQHTM